MSGLQGGGLLLFVVGAQGWKVAGWGLAGTLGCPVPWGLIHPFALGGLPFWPPHAIGAAGFQLCCDQAMVGLLLYLWYYGCSTVGPLLLEVVGEEA